MINFFSPLTCTLLLYDENNVTFIYQKHVLSSFQSNFISGLYTNSLWIRGEWNSRSSASSCSSICTERVETFNGSPLSSPLIFSFSYSVGRENFFSSFFFTTNALSIAINMRHEKINLTVRSRGEILSFFLCDFYTRFQLMSPSLVDGHNWWESKAFFSPSLSAS